MASIKEFLKQKVISVDTETTGLSKSDHAFCITMTYKKGRKYIMSSEATAE